MTDADIDRVFGRERLRMVTGRHVEVFREAAGPGERRRYTKRFLATDAGDFRDWTEREFRLLARLMGHGVGCVAEVVRFDRGSASETALVQTYDAGITVDHWATLLPVQRDGHASAHVFADCAHWWALARALLGALDAIHELRLVHLDLKPDNVCIPAWPADFDPRRSDQPLKPRFEALALIDFAFSLVHGDPLAAPLPLARQPDYDYQSPRLLAALEASRRGDLAPTRRLDWRCDVYSLAALLQRYLPDRRAPLEAGWDLPRLGAARSFVRRLLEVHDATLPAASARRPHAELIAQATRALDEPALAASLRRGWTLASDALFARDPSPTPITRIAPPMAVAAGFGPAPVSASTAPVATAKEATAPLRAGWSMALALAAAAAVAIPILGEAWWAPADPAPAPVAADGTAVASVAAAPGPDMPAPSATAPAATTATAPAASAVQAAASATAAASSPSPSAAASSSAASAPTPRAPQRAVAAAPEPRPARVARAPARGPDAAATPPGAAPTVGAARPGTMVGTAKAASSTARRPPERRTARLDPQPPAAKPAPVAATRPPPILPPPLPAPSAAPAPSPVAVAAASPAPASPPAPPPPVTAPAPAAPPAAIDLDARAQALLSNDMPRVAERAERLVLRVLFAAGRAEADDDAIRHAAGTLRLAPPERLTTVSAAQARELNDAADQAFRRRDADGPAARTLMARAFAANPLDGEIAGDLAALQLRAPPLQPELARQLALHALTTLQPRHPYGRLDDWITLATASALTGRERDARQAWFVALALAPQTERLCRAALNAAVRHGERLKPSVEAMLQRLRQTGRDERSALCEWPPHWATAGR